VSVPLILEDILLSKGQRRYYSDPHITMLSNIGENIKHSMKRKVEFWLFESLNQPEEEPGMLYFYKYKLTA
jgi:hypothetical protein